MASLLSGGWIRDFPLALLRRCLRQKAGRVENVCRKASSNTVSGFERARCDVQARFWHTSQVTRQVHLSDLIKIDQQSSPFGSSAMSLKFDEGIALPHSLRVPARTFTVRSSHSDEPPECAMSYSVSPRPSRWRVSEESRFSVSRQRARTYIT